MRKLRNYLKNNRYIVALAMVTAIVGILHFFTIDTGVPNLARVKS